MHKYFLTPAKQKYSPENCKHSLSWLIFAEPHIVQLCILKNSKLREIVFALQIKFCTIFKQFLQFRTIFTAFAFCESNSAIIINDNASRATVFYLMPLFCWLQECVKPVKSVKLFKQREILKIKILRKSRNSGKVHPENCL